MRLPQEFHRLYRRDAAPQTFLWIGLGAAAVLILIFAVLFQHFRRLRQQRNDPPTYLPTRFLKSKWRDWDPFPQAWKPPRSAATSSHALSEHARPSSEIPTSSSLRSTTHASSSAHVDGSSTLHLTRSDGETAASDAPDRRASVRSVMTLPAYHAAPRASETLIARAGERAGVDTVVEPPETAAEAEARREAEMAALYHIRQARRREQAEREQRRAERRQARDRGDWRRLEQLEHESRARAREREERNLGIATGGGRSRGASSAATSTTTVATTAGAAAQDSTQLIAELQSLRETNRAARRVSSVSYADLGLARHDGSRLRAESVESDHRPLLDSAASLGGRSRATSAASTREPSRSRASLLPARLGPGHSRNQSEDSFVSADGGEAPPDPPSYDDDASVHGGEAPPYPGAEVPPVPPVPPVAVDAGRRGSSPRPPSTLRQELRLDHDGAGAEAEDRAVPTATMAQEPRASGGRPQSGEVERGRQPARPAARVRELRVNTGPSADAPPAIEVLSATPVNSVPGTPAPGVGYAR